MDNYYEIKKERINKSATGSYRQIRYAVKTRVKMKRDPATIKSEIIKVRVTEHELAKIELYAQKKGWTVSQIIREYIKKLPND